MASITSIISLFVLLLVTFCSSVPIRQEYDISTSNYDLTTNKAIFEPKSLPDTDSFNNDESTSKSYPDVKRTVDKYNHNVYTTPSNLQKHNHGSYEKRSDDDSLYVNQQQSDSGVNPGTDEEDNESHSERSIEDLYYTTSPTESISEESHQLHGFDDYLFTTIESSTQFNNRAIRLNEDDSEEKPQRRAQSEDEFETTTNVESSSSVDSELYTHIPTSSSSSFVEHESHTFEPTSSVQSFGKTTGLIQNDESEEKFTTPEYTTVRSSSTTRFPVNSQRLTQTETIIPGKITETKIFAAVPSRTYVVNESIPVKQIQLNQDQTRPIFENEKSNY